MVDNNVNGHTNCLNGHQFNNNNNNNNNINNKTDYSYSYSYKTADEAGSLRCKFK
jgi:hypothetical protein